MTIDDRLVRETLDTGVLSGSSGLGMTKATPTEAVIHIDAEGRYVGANQAALDLLGVSLEELRASAPDRFAIRPTDTSEQAALRAEWETDGSRPLVGTAGLKRADGVEIRVSYAIEAAGSGFTARMWQVEGLPEAPPTVFTVGSVLREWRAAERTLAELHPDSREWANTASEIALLRSRYQELFRSVAPGSERGGEGTA
jgi:PAS domain-containing protein